MFRSLAFSSRSLFRVTPVVRQFGKEADVKFVGKPRKSKKSPDDAMSNASETFSKRTESVPRSESVGPTGGESLLGSDKKVKGTQKEEFFGASDMGHKRGYKKEPTRYGDWEKDGITWDF